MTDYKMMFGAIRYLDGQPYDPEKDPDLAELMRAVWHEDDVRDQHRCAGRYLAINEAAKAVAAAAAKIDIRAKVIRGIIDAMAVRAKNVGVSFNPSDAFLVLAVVSDNELADIARIYSRQETLNV